MQPDHDTVDLVRELRLRTWARRNHVPVTERSGDWHPIVLEEMRVRDAELDAERYVDEVLVSILGLARAAEAFEARETPAAETCEARSFARHDSSREEAADWERLSASATAVTRVLSRFVPLDPAPYRQRLDAAHAGPPAPNLVPATARVRTAESIESFAG